MNGCWGVPERLLGEVKNGHLHGHSRSTPLWRVKAQPAAARRTPQIPAEVPAGFYKVELEVQVRARVTYYDEESPGGRLLTREVRTSKATASARSDSLPGEHPFELIGTLLEFISLKIFKALSDAGWRKVA